MIEYLEEYFGKIIYEERIYNDIEELKQAIKKGTKVTLVLKPKGVEVKAVKEASVKEVENTELLRIVVKAYMTKKASPSFDFQMKWNKDIPMPANTMIITKIKETPGMVYVKGCTITRDQEWEGWIIKSAILSTEKV